MVQIRNGTNFRVTATEIIFRASDNDRISEEIVLEPTISQDNIEGKIYVFHDTYANDRVVATVQEKGALGAIEIGVAFVVPGFLRYRYEYLESVKAINIPVFEITTRDGDILWPLIEQDLVANITLIPSDEPNPWDVVLLSPGYYVITYFLMAFSVVNICLAIWKMKLFLDYYGGFRLSISLLVLFLEVISNLLRIIGLIDLFGVYTIYRELTFWSMYFLSFPFVISSIMLFLLHWHETMTSSSIVVHPFIVKMRIPFFVTSGVLLLLQIAVILTGVFNIRGFVDVTTVILVVISAALVVFYFVTGIKLLLRLKVSKKYGRKIRNLKETTVKILSSIGFLFVIVCIFVLFLTDVAYTPLGYFMCWYSLYAAINCTSLLNILAFGTPAHHKSSTSSTNKNNASNRDSTALDSLETSVTKG
jgi:hypothetical protein